MFKKLTTLLSLVACVTFTQIVFASGTSTSIQQQDTDYCKNERIQVQKLRALINSSSFLKKDSSGTKPVEEVFRNKVIQLGSPKSDGGECKIGKEAAHNKIWGAIEHIVTEDNREKATEALSNVVSSETDSDGKSSCTDAKTAFNTAKTTFDEKCGKSGVCEKNYSDCTDALDDLTGEYSDEDKVEAMRDCGGLAKEDFDKLKEEYDDLKEEREDLQKQINEDRQAQIDAKNDSQTKLLEMQEQLKQAENERENLTLERQAQLEALDTETAQKIADMEKQAQDLREQIEDFNLAHKNLTREYEKSKRQLQRRCWQFAETQVKQERDCLMNKRFASSRGGVNSTCKSNISMKAFTTASGEDKAKRIYKSLETYFNSCNKGKQMETDIKDLQKDINDQKDAIRRSIKKAENELTKLYQDKDIFKNATSKTIRQMGENYQLNLKQLSEKIVFLSESIRILEENIQRSETNSQRVAMENMIKSQQVEQEFAAVEEMYRVTRSLSGGANIESGSVVSSLSAYEGAITAAAAVTSACQCIQCYSGEEKYGECSAAAGFLQKHVSKYDADLASNACPSGKSVHSGSLRTRGGK